MLTKHAKPEPASKRSSEIVSALATVSEQELRGWVERLAVPRHYVMEAEENKAVGIWIAAQLQRLGYNVEMQGEWRNVVARSKNIAGPFIVVGAHYDSVGGCAGADDNASAVAAMLGCAKVCAQFQPSPPVTFVSFNREEDSLMGSRDFVEWLGQSVPFKIKVAHILEMVGYASDEPGSQRIPPGLPVKVSNIGNFLGLLANRDSVRNMEQVLTQAGIYLPEFPVIGLRVTLGLEKFFPVLLRSDHAPFWDAQVPATMWTDTSEFRNPHYHQPGDKPGTLNYGFLRAVTQLLAASVLSPETE